MNDICKDCGGMCCVGSIIDVYSTDEIYYDDTLVCESEDDMYDRQMITINNKCIALKDGMCSIYDKRPLVCREFKVDSLCCKNFRCGKINSHDCIDCVVSNSCSYENKS